MEDEVELENRLKELTSPQARNHCEVLFWLKSGRVSSMCKAMALKEMNKFQGCEW